MLYALYLPYEYTEVVCEDGTGPTVGDCVCGLIEATDEAKAKGLFVSLLRKHPKHAGVLSYGENPFSQIVCEHALRLDHFDVTNVERVVAVPKEGR